MFQVVLLFLLENMITPRRLSNKQKRLKSQNRLHKNLKRKMKTPGVSELQNVLLSRAASIPSAVAPLLLLPSVNRP